MSEAGARRRWRRHLLTDTLLRNVKVLAIGQNVEEKNGQPVVVGSNATLELDPAQAETIILAQRTGQLSLVLRSMLGRPQTAAACRRDKRATASQIVRYGDPARKPADENRSAIQRELRGPSPGGDGWP